LVSRTGRTESQLASADNWLGCGEGEGGRKGDVDGEDGRRERGKDWTQWTAGRIVGWMEGGKKVVKREE